MPRALGDLHQLVELRVVVLADDGDGALVHAAVRERVELRAQVRLRLHVGRARGVEDLLERRARLAFGDEERLHLARAQRLAHWMHAVDDAGRTPHDSLGELARELGGGGAAILGVADGAPDDDGVGARRARRARRGDALLIVAASPPGARRA